MKPTEQKLGAICLNDYITQGEEPLKKTIGGLIQKRRKEKGVTQTEMAAALNLSISQIRRIEAGEHAALVKVMQIMEYLDIEVTAQPRPTEKQE